MNAIAIAVISLLLSVAARPAAGAETWVHSGGKVQGLILTLACEPIAGARITFTDKKRTQLVTPDPRGRFIVELPPGTYQVTVFVPGRGEITPEELVLYQAKNGALRLSVDTGVWTHPDCFGPDPEDLLIPDERGIVSDKLLGKPPTSKP